MSIDARFMTRRIASAIADEQPVDWGTAERALGTDAKALENLRVLHDVASAMRSIHGQAPRESDARFLFKWGPLEVSASLGQGQTGEVFRAFDPVLQRDVALKLRAQRNPLSDPGNAQLLDEARQLARIRHRNVLAVYGAAVHDGRAGIWSELIDGRTLSEMVENDGVFGAEEALRIGLDVARALGVVHAQGLVHGDVKAENVMRERGGRIVLMDFGASARQEDFAARLSISGTRRYLAPEVLDGASPDVRSDLYALAVLLHYLLSGTYPRGNEHSLVALAQRRPDLPASLCAQLDAMLAADPAQRPQNAAAFAHVLLGHMPGRPAAQANATRRLWITAAATILAALVIGVTANALNSPAWRIEARFIDAASQTTMADGAAVQLGDTLSVRLHATRPTHVYVLNEDSNGEVNVLFPLDGLEQHNPLPGGHEHHLPGAVQGRELAWEIASAAASESFVLIASADPLPELGERVARMQAADVDLDAQRGATRARALPADSGMEAASLATLVQLAKQEQADPERLLVMHLRLPHAVH